MLKPVASGWHYDDPDNDIARLLAAMGEEYNHISIQKVSAFRYPAAISPDLAAREAGEAIEPQRVIAFCTLSLEKARRDGVDYCFIEGVGGVMSPIADNYSSLYLIKELGLPVIIVTGAYLGTISHTLTALYALQGEGIEVSSIVMNDAQNNGAQALAQQQQLLASYVSQDVIAVPYTNSSRLLCEKISQITL